MSDYKQLVQGIADGEKFTSLLKYVTNIVSSIALFVTLALLLALAIWAIIIRNSDEERLKSTRRIMLGIVIGYSVGVISTIGTLKLLRDLLKGNVTWHIWIIVGMFVLIVVGTVTTLVLQKKQKSYAKWIALGFAVAVLAATIVLLCLVKPLDDGYRVYVAQQSWLMYLLSALLVATIVVLTFLGGRNSGYNTKSLTYAAICIAASFALSYIKFFSLPQGGSVTFASLLPLALYSYMFGTKKGVIAGVVYGLLQFIQSPQPYHMMQILLDYPIAFGAIGVAGIGRKLKIAHCSAQLQFVFGSTIAVILRYLAHVFSGYFVFYTWAGDQHPLVYSLVYNIFTFADLAIVLIMGVLALSAKSFKRIVLSADSAESI